jgi:hypothetical protein
LRNLRRKEILVRKSTKVISGYRVLAICIRCLIGGLLTNPDFPIQYRPLRAGVAELADALRSGRSGRKAIRVQLPASAPARETGLFFLMGFGV